MNVRPNFKKIGGEISSSSSSSPSSIQPSERVERVESIERVEKQPVSLTLDDIRSVIREENQKLPGTISDNKHDNESFMGLDPKLQKQLEGTVTLFNTLKEFSSNPLQKAIETKVGELAAGVVENAFGRPQPKQKGLVAEFLSPILDSQFGSQLGASLGQRGPEMVEAMGRTFGKEKAANMIDGILGSGKTKQLGIGGVGGIPGAVPPGASPPGAVSEQTKPQTQIELLLTLSPDNPEHITAYGDSQGGLPPDVARKMLMIHQDAFIKQMGVSKQGQGQMPGQMPGQTSEQPGQQQVMETLQQFSGDMNKALGNTNTIIGELYKKIEGLENDINILKLKGGKDLSIKEKDEGVIEAVDTLVEKVKEKEKGIVKGVDDKWTDEDAQEAEFRMRT